MFDTADGAPRTEAPAAPRRSRLVVAIIAAAIAVLVGVAAVQTRGGSTGTVDIFDLAAGDCMQIPANSQQLESEVERVSCTAPHDGEVIAVIDLVQGSWQQTLLDLDTEAPCTAAAGLIADDLALTVDRYDPTRNAYRAGGRKALCLAMRSDGQPLEQPLVRVE